MHLVEEVNKIVLYFFFFYFHVVITGTIVPVMIVVECYICIPGILSPLQFLNLERVLIHGLYELPEHVSCLFNDLLYSNPSMLNYAALIWVTE